MPPTGTARPTLRHWIFWAIALVAGSAVIASARQDGRGGAEKGRPRLEYLSQEVQSEAIVQTLNDLDGQGWEMFQVVPVWKFRNENGESALEAKSYQVFGRRPLKAAK
jgi:hypothetical protein